MLSMPLARVHGRHLRMRINIYHHKKRRRPYLLGRIQFTNRADKMKNPEFMLRAVQLRL